MMKDYMKPNTISDIVQKMDEYIPTIRRAGEEDGREIMNSLLKYITDYFTNETIDIAKLQQEAIAMTDGVYKKIMNLDQRDGYVNIYFSQVLNRLYWELREQNILIFFIVDNEIRDDRFKLLIELFQSMQFGTIFPYEADIFESSDKYSKYPNKTYSEIEMEIESITKQKKHILYVEKDDSVNYLDEILRHGEELQNTYACIFRNESIETNPKATRLLGSFGDMLKITEK